MKAVDFRCLEVFNSARGAKFRFIIIAPASDGAKELGVDEFYLYAKYDSFNLGTIYAMTVDSLKNLLKKQHQRQTTNA